MTPGGGVTPGGIGGDTPKLGSKWDDETPRAGGFGVAETPSGRKKSRWDQVGRMCSLLLFYVLFVRLSGSCPFVLLRRLSFFCESDYVCD